MNNNILSLISQEEESTDSIMKIVASNVRSRRLEMNLTQKAFAAKIGMALPTYRRFEALGEISLRKLVAIAGFFNETDNLKKLFTKQQYASLDDLIAKTKPRKRATSNG